jgi:hypothetical protein
MNRWVALLAFVLWASSPLQQAHARRVLYAVAIGNNAAPRGEESLVDLRYADDDAVKWLRLFGGVHGRSALLAVFDDDTARRYPDLRDRALSPSYGNLKRTLEAYRERMRADRARGDQPVLFLTFSGHGVDAERGEPALALVDQPLTRTRLFGEILPLTVDAETHLIIDACRAAGVLGVRGAFDVELEGETAPLDERERGALLEAQSLSAFPRVGALLASSADEESYEWSRIEGGVFSHELMSALRGAADVNGDLAVHYSEVRAFLAAANRDIQNARARPNLVAHVPAQRADAPLLELADLQGVRFLHGDAGKLGRFYVELDNGERILEANLAAGTRVALALPRDHEVFVRNHALEAELPRGESPVRIAALSFTRSAVAARGSVERSLRDALFASAYGSDYYRGYVQSLGVEGVTFGAPKPIAEDRAAPPVPPRRTLAIATTTLAAGSFVAFATSLGLALASKHDFDSTEREKEASELRDAYQRRSRAAIATGVLSAVSGAAALWLWLDVSRSAPGDARASVNARLRF